MTHDQWKILLDVVSGRTTRAPAGFIIDSPWLPGWCSHTVLDYYGDDRLWLDDNLRALREFPQAIFLPGFWSEYGMCTEPSAFGSKCIWHERELPFAEPVISTPEQMAALRRPDPRHDGLLPFVLRRLVNARPEIERQGHAIRFAVARGPLNIASFLMGTTEFLMATQLQPAETHTMLKGITDFLVDWLRLQKEKIPTIEGIFLLDDIVGFLSDADIQAFALPYLQQAFAAFEAPVRFFHNDAHGKVCAPHLAGAGINLFNFSHQHSIADMRKWTGGQVALLGNLPPRDILAGGTPDQVRAAARAMRADAGDDGSRLIWSCGGGMSPGTPTANIRAFLEEVNT